MFAVSDVLNAGLRGVCSEFVAARLLLKITLYVAPCHGNSWFIEVLKFWVDRVHRQQRRIEHRAVVRPRLVVVPVGAGQSRVERRARRLQLVVDRLRRQTRDLQVEVLLERHLDRLFERQLQEVHPGLGWRHRLAHHIPIDWRRSALWGGRGRCGLRRTLRLLRVGWKAEAEYRGDQRPDSGGTQDMNHCRLSPE